MPRRILSSILFTLCSLAFASAPLAQVSNANDQTQTDAQQKAQAEKEERERRAWALLDEVIEQANALRRPENRAHVQATAASLLWGRDEKRARELLRAALNAIVEQFGNVDLSNPNYQQHLQPLVQTRATLLQTLAQHDARLALELLRSTRPPDYSPRSSHQYDSESQLENNLLQHLVMQDPREATKVAEEMLKKGVSQQILPLIHQYQDKDPATAAKILSLIIAKLRNADFAAQPDALLAAITLAQMGMTLNNAARERTNGNSAPPFITPENTRELLEIIVSGSSNLPSGNYGYLSPLVSNNMKDIERYAPASAPVLQRRMKEMLPHQESTTRAWDEFNRLLNGANSANFDAALDYVAHVPPEMRDNMYQNIAWNYFNKGETERARQIIDEKISSSAERARLTADFERNAAQRSVQEGNLAAARQFISMLHTDDERAAMLVQLALEVSYRNQKAAAVQMLDEAFNLIAGRPRNAARLNAQLALAQAYAQMNSPRIFELLEQMIEPLNELLAAEIVLMNFSGNSPTIADNGTIDMTDEFLILHDDAIGYYSSFAQHLGVASQIDFERARAHRPFSASRTASDGAAKYRSANSAKQRGKSSAA